MAEEQKTGCSPSDCAGCSHAGECGSKPQSLIKPENKKSHINHVIAVVSGKGGVGKSMVTASLARLMREQGFSVGIMDADITGPSIPKMYGIHEKAKGDGENIFPCEAKDGTKIMSINLLLPEEDDPVIWRGPVISGVVTQFWTDVAWGELDYFLIDLPPGTSDIHLTVVQTLALTGAIVVSTPQAVALADARKGINMFTNDKVNVPILGLVENMAWFTPAELPENKYYIFGKEGAKRLAEKMNVPLLGQIPIVQSICESGDKGTPVALDENTVTGRAFLQLAAAVVRQVDRRNMEMAPTRIVEVHK